MASITGGGWRPCAAALSCVVVVLGAAGETSATSPPADAAVPVEQWTELFVAWATDEGYDVTLVACTAGDALGACYGFDVGEQFVVAAYVDGGGNVRPIEQPQLAGVERQELQESFVEAATEHDMVITAAGCSVNDKEATCYGRNGEAIGVGTRVAGEGQPAEWTLTEFVNAATLVQQYPLDNAAITANAFAQGIDVSGCSFPPSITESITVDCPVVNGDGSEGTWAVTVNVDNSVSGSYVETQAALVHADIDSRTWQLIARDPDAHTGEMIRVYGHVTQADSATGTEIIRADVDGQPHDDWFDYDVNTLLAASAASNDLASIVNGDLFVAEVTVVGSFTYDTSIGGSTTVPLLAVDSITVTGHES